MLCTGRAIESSSRYYNAIGAQGPMVFFNGVVVVDVPGLRHISSNLMSLDVVNFGIDVAHSMGIHFQVFLPAEKNNWETLLIEKQCPESQMYQKHTGIMPKMANLKEAIANPNLKGCVKAMFICQESLVGEIRQKMHDRFGSKIYMVRTFPTFLEIMDGGVSKGEGLKTAMECRGLKPHEIIAFGDEENDLPMFKIAGFSAAPSSAKENIRQTADFVFGSNAEEGLAAFLEETFLGRIIEH